MATMHVIKASAGSGKTYNLAKTYIKYLIGKPTGQFVTINDEGDTTEMYRVDLRRTNYHQHLLAITFTNKATDEMKRRIIEDLYWLSQGTGDFYRDFKTEFTGDINDVVKAAGNALADIVYHYDMFNVSTIDSFFQTILRTFAHELDRDAGYELQIDSDLALHASVAEFLRTLGDKYNPDNNKIIDAWAKRFIRELINDNKSWKIFKSGEKNEFFKYAKNIDKEIFRKNTDAILHYLDDLKDGNDSRIERFMQALKEPLESFKAQVEKHTPENNIAQLKDIGITKEIVNGRCTLAKIFNNKGGDYITDLKKELPDRFLNIIRKPESQFNKTLLGSIPADIINAASSWAENIAIERGLYDLCKSLIVETYKMGILGSILNHLDKYRKSNNTLLISDTNELIHNVVNSGVPFVYERIGTWISNYFIDEFQDTSEMQYDNFLPLLQESVALGGHNLIIGDEKQSIYRFRNASPDILRDKIESDFGEEYNASNLRWNFRTFEEVVNFNNRLFTHLTSVLNPDDKYPKLGKTYSNVVQKARRTDVPGGVIIHRNNSWILHNLDDMPYDEEDVKKSKELTFDDVVEIIPYYINEIRTRGFEPRDIAILVSTGATGSMLIERILAFNHACEEEYPELIIPVTSEESLLLSNSPIVRTVISVLRFIETSISTSIYDTDEPAREITTAQVKLIQQQRLFDLLRRFNSKLSDYPDVPAGKLLLECFNDIEQLDSIEATITDYNEKLQSLMPNPQEQLLTISAVINRILNVLIINPGDTQHPDAAFIIALQDLASQFDQQGGGTIKEFLNLWDVNQDHLSISADVNANAVTVQTVHKSKGLEYPCVIIPHFNWNIEKRDDIEWIEKDQWIEATKNFIDIDPEIVPPILPINMKVASVLPSFGKFYQSKTEDTLIDNLNRAYVAFTRPEQELHVFITTGNKDKSIGKLVSDFVKDDPQARFLYPDDDGTIVYGEFTGKFVKPEKAPFRKYTNVDHINITNGEQRVSRLEAKVEFSNEATRYGRRLHTLFSMIEKPDDLERALLYCESHGKLLPNETVEWRKRILHDLQNPDIARWFSPLNEVLNERSIAFIDKEHNHAIKRPDRIVKTPEGEYIVIDFKFGEKELSAHRRQVKEYMHLIRLATGANVSGYVWYVSLQKYTPVVLD